MGHHACLIEKEHLFRYRARRKSLTFCASTRSCARGNDANIVLKREENIFYNISSATRAVFFWQFSSLQPITKGKVNHQSEFEVNTWSCREARENLS